MLVLSYDRNRLVETTHLAIVQREDEFFIMDVDHAASSFKPTPLVVAVYATREEAQMALHNLVANKDPFSFLQ
ncbi:MAG: hypothetical protein KW793_04915 [Candidatus Doudnabacteria bacterium]|nr:hypothetical protein [Candidatus Doudnabacteria bacterium]